MGAELPADFFADLKDTGPVDNVSGHVKPSIALRWYDGIIDDMLANPGTTVKDTAARLGRHPNTISAIINSDLFKSRWQQRREQFSMSLDMHLSQKLAQVAEKALEHTITTLDKKRDSVPLPILKDLALGSLDRLGYGPKKEAPAAVVNIDNRSVSASPEALERARARMRELEQSTSPRAAGVREQGFLDPLGPREASVRPVSDPYIVDPREASDRPVGGPNSREAWGPELELGSSPPVAGSGAKPGED